MVGTTDWHSGAGIRRRRERLGLADVVLIVDDHEAFRESTVEILRLAGFEVIEASDGFAGWTALKRHRPKVTILDIILPNMSGYELCDRIRTHSDLGAMLVVAATATDAIADESGFDVCLQKPFAFDELLTWVRYGLSR